MKGKDVVSHIEKYLGNYTTLFNSQIPITSLTSSLGVATAVTSSPHGLSTGDTCIVSGATQYINITSITRDGNIVTVQTAQNNLLPFIDNKSYSGYIPQYATLENVTPAEYDGTWEIYTSLDELTFTFKITTTPTTPATVNGRMLIKDFNNYNGRKTITVIDANTFTYNVGQDSLPATGSIVINSINIENVATTERINRIYDKNATRNAENWLYVLIGDAQVYKKDGTPANDIDGVKYSSELYTQQLLQNFSIIAILPEKDSVSAGDIADIAKNEIRRAILKILGNARFDTNGFMQKQYESVSYIGDETLGYEDRLPYYAHAYNFSTHITIFEEDVFNDIETAPLKRIESYFDEGLEVKINF